MFIEEVDGTRDQVPFIRIALYSSTIANRQFGSFEAFASAVAWNYCFLVCSFALGVRVNKTVLD